MAEWIISGNPNEYDVIGAFHTLGKIDWKQSANIKPGDIVYIYVTGKIKAIMFKCRANKTELSVPDIDDQEFNLSGEYDGSYGRYMELEMLEEYHSQEYSREALLPHGYRSPQGPVRMTESVKKYLESLSVKDSTMIDYLGVLDYLEQNREIPYHNPEEESNPDEMRHLNGIREKGQNATAEIKKMAVMCSSHFGLDKCLPISWLDGSNTKTCRYLWAQMKYSKYESSPVSISVFVEMCSETEACYRISLELKNDGASPEAIDKYHTYLELPLNKNAGLDYFAGSNALGRPQPLTESQEIVKRKVAGKVYRKVQVGKYIKKADGRDNAYFEKELLKAVKSLLPYYRYVLDLPSVSPEDFDPGITKEKWLELLNNSDIFDDNSLLVMASIFNLGGEATCSQLEKKYGRSQKFYNIVSTKLAARITKAVKIDNIPINEYGTESRWRILYTGRDAQSEESGVWVWRLRPELYEALKGFDILKYLPQGGEETMTEYSKNMILYGPPGTGKTYNSVNYAVAICEGKSIEDVCNEDYSDVIERYNELKASGRIAFTTFHQSYGYEEFIEGIRPVMDEESEDDGSIRYQINPGIFKSFCEKASRPILNKNIQAEFNNSPTVWKVSLEGTGENPTRTECLANNHIRIGYDSYGPTITDETEVTSGKTVLNSFISKMKIGDIVFSCYSATTIDAIGVVAGDYEWHDEYTQYKRLRNVKWLAKGIREDITGINGEKTLTLSSTYALNNVTLADVMTLLEKVAPNSALTEEKQENYVFVIDEINRGNISKIFGELITLMEDTKRKGCLEAASAVLPYSGEEFSVPNNVYILGTMNTADRSIALMDTALRRRFQFVEMMPDAQVLRKIGAGYVGDLDVAQMLEIINERIVFLYDREHTIGHAFFTKLKDSPSVDTLASIFKEKIVPLLQEYFYEDYHKIRMVLGDDGKDRELQFVWEDNVESQLFKSDFSAVTDIAEKRYTINEKAFSNIESYKRII